ncbi:MAG: 3-hydroxyacyl-CoA dehydrogenase family protein [Verrucomicrobiae bacterium]|nr:3-hydroxyacyl-CoA dehydrogenase family protein [Verrucomicrobiae bacterium]
MNPQETTIGICGIGQMGASSAVAFQRAGYRVLLWARDETKLRAVEAELARQSAWSNDHIGPAKRDGGQIILEPNLARLDQESDVVLDCILEVMDFKTTLFRQFDDAKKRGALFLSATSGLSITEMGRGGECEALLVGAHFWNPPHLIPVVEMIAGEDTPADRLEAACALMEDIEKIPVRCKDVPGFIGNRIMHAMWREAAALVDAGVCTAEEVDKVVKLTFALRLPALGPMENMDLVGLDAAERVQKYLLPDLANNTVPSACLSEKVAAGELGMKSGKGFYDWTKRDPKQLIENRDSQIARQVQFLKEIGEI